MVEKPIFENEQRFSFVLSVNDYIICRRNFWINNFKERSLGSVQLADAVEHCVDKIKNDLKAKTNVYLMYTAPQVFKSKEQMDKWVKHPTFKLDVPSFAVISNSDDTYLWTGSEMKLYDKPFNKSEYAQPANNDVPWVLKFAFLDGGKEVSSLSWDGNVYPKFVRTNIDLQNSKNKYKNSEVYAPMEEFLLDIFIKTQPDLIPEIIKIISTACSNNNVSEYETYLNYGGRKYPVDIDRQNEMYAKRLDIEYRKKMTY